MSFTRGTLGYDHPTEPLTDWHDAKHVMAGPRACERGTCRDNHRVGTQVMTDWTFVLIRQWFGRLVSNCGRSRIAVPTRCLTKLRAIDPDHRVRREIAAMRVMTIREYPVSTRLPQHTPNAAELIALALDHRIRAERSTCPAEQLELDRVADIYEVLATIDLPIATFTEVEGRSWANTRQMADVVE